MGNNQLPPGEVAARVIVALVEMSERRAALLPPLTAAVELAVAELGDGRDTNPAWRQELNIWKIDTFDRLRVAHDDLLILEAQAGDIVQGLRALLDPTADHRSSLPPPRAHELLAGIADRRAVYLKRLGLAIRGLRPRLTDGTVARLRAAHRALVAEEANGRQLRGRIEVLLTFRAHWTPSRPADLR